MNRVQAKYAVPHGGRMSEPKYWSEAGQTKHNDPTRLVWFGPCGYWTDDWSHLPTPGGGFKMPICPLCGAPGFQQEYRDFMKRSPGEKEWCWTTLGEPPKLHEASESSLSGNPPAERKKEETGELK